MDVVEKVSAAWHRDQDSGDRTTLQEEMGPLRRQRQRLWDHGTTLPSWMVRAFCNDVRKLEPALWTFLTVEGVEPTNNAAERALRPAMLWRTGCFGADSADREGTRTVLTGQNRCFPRLSHLWVDADDRGRYKDWIETTLGWTVTVVQGPSRWVWCHAEVEPPPVPTGFEVLPRRLSKDYEELTETSEALIYRAMIGLLLSRLAR